MWNNRIYKDDDPKPDLLEQGDVLRVTPELAGLLETYHPYYAKHPDNQFYVVLTQSCDLVRRAGTCKARYIAIAPARPLRSVIRREFGGRLHISADAPVLGSTRVRAEVDRFVEHLVNNNEPTYFYYEAEPTVGIASPSCAVLALPISFKSEHYDKFLAAKAIGISDTFQAKLGWLLGQMYSRVGTPDVDEKIVQAKRSDVLDSMGLWLDQGDLDEVIKLLGNWRTDHPGQTADQEVIAALLRQIKKKKDLAIEAVLDQASTLGLVANPSPKRRSFRHALEKDPKFAAQFR